MSAVDNFLCNVEARYPSIYQMLGGDRARIEFEDRNREIERMKRILNESHARIIVRVTEIRVVRIAKIGGARCSAGQMEEVPVLYVR